MFHAYTGILTILCEFASENQKKTWKRRWGAAFWMHTLDIWAQKT